jgi:hypothetical protein
LKGARVRCNQSRCRLVRMRSELRETVITLDAGGLLRSRRHARSPGLTCVKSSSSGGPTRLSSTFEICCFPRQKRSRRRSGTRVSAFRENKDEPFEFLARSPGDRITHTFPPPSITATFLYVQAKPRTRTDCLGEKILCVRQIDAGTLLPRGNKKDGWPKSPLNLFLN